MKSLDLEVWDGHGAKKVVLFKAMTDKGLVPSRTVDVGKRGTHRIELRPGEDDRLAHIEGNRFAFPYLYSIPPGWAKSPAELVIPRAIAKADGLTIDD